MYNIKNSKEKFSIYSVCDGEYSVEHNLTVMQATINSENMIESMKSENFGHLCGYCSNMLRCPNVMDLTKKLIISGNYSFIKSAVQVIEDGYIPDDCYEDADIETIRESRASNSSRMRRLYVAKCNGFKADRIR